MIISFDQVEKNTQLLTANSQKLIMVGGVFDLLHIGHIRFLKKAREKGDALIVLLESDSSVKRKKGSNRPINKQENRAVMLTSLRMVDYVVLLPDPTTDEDYKNVTKLIKPAIIATTKGDMFLAQKKAAAAMVNAQVVEVITQVEDKSTSHLAQLLEKELL